MFLASASSRKLGCVLNLQRRPPLHALSGCAPLSDMCRQHPSVRRYVTTTSCALSSSCAAFERCHAAVETIPSAVTLPCSLHAAPSKRIFSPCLALASAAEPDANSWQQQCEACRWQFLGGCRNIRLHLALRLALVSPRGNPLPGGGAPFWTHYSWHQ